MSRYAAAPIACDAPAEGFSGWNDHPLRGAFAARLYATLGRGHADTSFEISGPHGPVVRVRATMGDGQISYWGLPAAFAIRQGAEPRHVKDGLSFALNHLLERARAAGATRLVVGSGAAERCGPLASLMVDQGAVGQVQASAVIDLAPPLEILRADIRDSYRSLINWGGRNLRLAVVDAQNTDRSAFGTFPDIHARIAGGSARGADYWRVYWEEIIAGRAEMILGHLEDGTLAAGSIVVWEGGTAYYASGVYDRDRFDKPLGHFPLWTAIQRAREAGLARFDLGEIPARGQASDKEVAIAFFKRGFTSGRELRLRWVLDVPA